MVKLKFTGDYARVIPGHGTYSLGQECEVSKEKADELKATGLFVEVNKKIKSDD